MRIWNFNNGALLRDLLCYDKCELTAIVCSKMLIITGGWNKRIATYVDKVSASPPTSTTLAHRHLRRQAKGMATYVDKVSASPPTSTRYVSTSPPTSTR